MEVKRITKGNYIARIYLDECAASPREWDNLCQIACIKEYRNWADKKTPCEAVSEDLLEEVEALNPVHIAPFWHNGDFIGYAYVTKKGQEKIGTPAEYLAEVVKAELNEYSQFLSGEVYGYEIKEEIQGQDEKGSYTIIREIDSCWGFIGFDHIKEEVEAILGGL